MTLECPNPPPPETTTDSSRTAQDASSSAPPSTETSARSDIVNTTGPKRILIVGDWVVDDHWVTSTHRAAEAIRRGRTHVRALHPVQGIVESLGAAGRAASILQCAVSADSSGSAPLQVIGLGNWCQDDHEVITSLLKPAHAKGLTPFRLGACKDLPKPSASTTLINMAVVLAKSHAVTCRNRRFHDDGTPKVQAEALTSDEEPYKHLPFFDFDGTNRVIRVYQQHGSDLEIMNRIDWELEVPSMFEAQPPVWVTEPETADRLEKELEPELTHIDAVVLYDHSKGVVSEKTIEIIRRQPAVAKVPWFIMTKSWAPSWFDAIMGLDVRLVMFHQTACRAAVSSSKLSSWLDRKRGIPTDEAIDRLDEVYEKFKRTGSTNAIVALPGAFTVLARVQTDKEAICYTQQEANPSNLDEKWPMATSFFSGLVGYLTLSGSTSAAVWDSIRRSLVFAHNAALAWKAKLTGIDGAGVDAETLELSLPKAGEKARELESKHRDRGFRSELHGWHQTAWSRLSDEWKSALSTEGSGVIGKPPSEQRVELWRAMTALERYVCCAEEPRSQLLLLKSRLDQFVHRDKAFSPSTHPSFMLCAPPGSGKTYLAKCLAREFGMEFLGYNITQMISMDDLLSCFDMIVSRQTQLRDRDKELLVFIDEINAKLAGHHVYQTFLTPLIDGEYVRNGKTFLMQPCAWIFAGTERPLSSTAVAAEKALDFESRLALAPIQLSSEESKFRRLENVYVCLSIIRRQFPDVNRVTRAVLRLFRDIRPSATFRDLEHLIKRFHNVQYSKICLRNVPDHLDERYGIGRSEPPRKENEEWVQIRD